MCHVPNWPNGSRNEWLVKVLNKFSGERKKNVFQKPPEYRKNIHFDGLGKLNVVSSIVEKFHYFGYSYSRNTNN